MSSQLIFEKFFLVASSIIGAATANVVELPILSASVIESPIYDFAKVVVGGSIPVLIRELVGWYQQRKKRR